MIRRPLFGCLTILAFLAGSVAPLYAANDCNADIRGTLKRKDDSQTKTVYGVQVDVTVRETCAKVRFDLVVVEDLGGGEKEEVRVSRAITIRDATTGTMKLDYKLKRGRTIADHRFEQTSCEICE
jgi:hypothetical protein